MGIALFTFGGMLARLRHLAAWLVHAPGAQRSMRPPQAPKSRSTSTRACSSWSALSGSSRDKPARPVRVVRVVEPMRTPAGAGRMFISGRMADVCAELDRLAALETAPG